MGLPWYRVHIVVLNDEPLIQKEFMPGIIALKTKRPIILKKWGEGILTCPIDHLSGSYNTGFWLQFSLYTLC